MSTNSALNLLSNFSKSGTPAEVSFPVLSNEDLIKKATKAVEAMVTIRTLDGVLKVAKADLRASALPKFFENNRDSADLVTSVVIPTIHNDKVAHDLIVTFTNGYSAIDAAKRDQIIDVIGEEAFNANFVETFSLNIDGDSIPEEKRTPFVEGLIRLLAEFGIDSSIVTAKGGYKPIDGFNKTRAKMPIAINDAIEQIMPTPASVGEYKKTKAKEPKPKATPASKAKKK